MSDTNNQSLPKMSDTKRPQDTSDTSNQPLLKMSDTNNQPLHEMSDTQLPPQDSPKQTTSQYNHPCGDLLDQGRRRDYMDVCVPLQRALIIGDWEAVKKILDSNRKPKDLLRFSISEDKRTALYLATRSRSSKMVKNLVDRMTEQQLVFQDKYGQTALDNVARVGNVDMARVMVERCPQLLTIRDEDDDLPIYFAAIYGRHDMLTYLYENYYKSMAGKDWTFKDIRKFFYKCIQADLFDCALQILDDNIQIEFSQAEYAPILYRLAQKPYAFNDTISWKFTWMLLVKRESVATKLVRKIWKNILERSSDEIRDICKHPMVIAAEMGNTRFLVELIRAYPEISFTFNDDGQSIFHIAVCHRHESIYNLLYEMGSMHDLMSGWRDNHNNNMLHLAGMKAKSPFKDVSGAAFQMQREWLWFEEVRSKVPPYFREEQNYDGHTPFQLFTKSHQDMVSEGEKWMKETANQCMVVAALITTVVFSAAFTFPGGYNQNNGLPIFLKDEPFIGFIIFDAISLILSSASILMFLSILTSRYAHEDFRISLPRKLMIGLTTLFLSIITMMVVFTISFFVLYRNKLISVPIIISVVAVVPIVLYMILQFPLLVDVYRSTYGNKYLFKPKKRVLFYRNPRF